MSKSLDDVLSGLGEDAEVVKEALEAEKQRGIEESRRKGQDIKKYMTQANRYKDLLKTVELDPEAEDLQDQLAAKVTAGKSTATEFEKQLSAMQKQIKSLTQTAEENAKIAQEKTQRYQRAKLSEVLKDKLGDKIYASDQVVKNLILEGRVKLANDDETVTYMQEDGSELDLKRGLDSFLKANPSIVKNTQTPGSGSSATKKMPSNAMSKSDWDKLPDKGPGSRMDFLLKGGTITD